VSGAAATAPNEAAIRAVVAMIELHPELWHQGALSTHRAQGICHDLVGWTLKLAGYSLAQLVRQDPYGRTLYREAQRLLGLSDEQADRLFRWAKGDPPGRPHPNVSGLKARIRAVTGVSFKPGPA
jgi:hypothetical protein